MIIPDFPNTYLYPVDQTSESTYPPDKVPYNCIAWACGINTLWFWPEFGGHWPPNIPRVVHIDYFIRLFQLFGYEVCLDGNLEPGIEKVAIYELNARPTHAARQLDNGLWTSKLGPDIDITHVLVALEDIKPNSYGQVSTFMKRPRPAIPVVIQNNQVP